MSESNFTFAKSGKMCEITGKALLALAGGIAIVNIELTKVGFSEAGYPSSLAYLFAVSIAAFEAGFTTFLLSPSTWGKIYKDMRSSAKQISSTGKEEGDGYTVAMVITSVVLVGLFCLAFIAALVLVYIVDWQSTWEGLSNQGVNLEGLWMGTPFLCFGPEAMAIMSNQVNSLARTMRLLELKSGSQEEIELAYQNTLSRKAKKAAKRAAEKEAANFVNSTGSNKSSRSRSNKQESGDFHTVNL